MLFATAKSYLTSSLFTITYYLPKTLSGEFSEKWKSKNLPELRPKSFLEAPTHGTHRLFVRKAQPCSKKPWRSVSHFAKTCHRQLFARSPGIERHLLIRGWRPGKRKKHCKCSAFPFFWNALTKKMPYIKLHPWRKWKRQGLQTKV